MTNALSQLFSELYSSSQQINNYNVSSLCEFKINYVKLN